MSRRFFSLVLVLLISACTLPSPQAPAPTPTALPVPPTLSPTVSQVPPTLSPTLTQEPPTPVVTNPPPDLEKLKNGIYTLSALENRQVTLVGGEFEVSEPAKHYKASGRLVEPVVLGDMNGDGLVDTALMIASNTGGTGTFFELILLDAQKGQVASIVVGDRIAIKALSIQDGAIVLEYLRAGPNDGLCCPSQHARTSYRLKDGKLEKVSDQVLP